MLIEGESPLQGRDIRSRLPSKVLACNPGVRCCDQLDVELLLVITYISSLKGMEFPETARKG